MRLAKVLSVLAIVLGYVGVAGAADDAHDKAARELLRVMRVQDMSKNGAATMVDVMVQSNPALQQYRDVITEWSNKVMTWDAMLPGMIEAYKSAFTTEEMRKITAFYQTAEGQKLLEKMPGLMQKLAQLGTTLAQAHQSELQAKIAERSKELEKDKKKEPVTGKQ